MPTPSCRSSDCLHHPVVRAAIVACLVLPATARGQQQDDGVPDLKTLLERVRRAHAPLDEDGRPTDPPRANRFRAQLVIGAIGSAAQGSDTRNIDVQLEAQYLRPADPKVGGLIQYLVNEKGTQLQRGRDADGVWTAKDGKVFDISRASAREYGTERQAVIQNIRLADQLLRFLDPAAEITKLRSIDGPRRATPALRSLRDRSWLTVSGISESFPTYNAGGQRGPASLRLWIDAERFELGMIDIRPVVQNTNDTEPSDDGWDFGKSDSKPAPTSAPTEKNTPTPATLPGGESVLLDALQRRDRGPLVPTVLRIRRLSPTGRPERGAAVQVRILSLELDPADLTARSIARPGR
jgi:hypothetical protein